MSTSTVESQVLTRSEADLVVRNTVIDAYETEGYKWLEADSLTRKLAFYLDAKVDEDRVIDMIGHLRDLEEIKDGTSEQLRVSPDLTENNAPYLVAYYEGELNVSVNHVLDEAGFAGEWLLRYSVDV